MPTLISRRKQVTRDGSEQERLKSSLKSRERGPSTPRLLGSSRSNQWNEEQTHRSLVEAIMANKVLGAYVVADLLFVITGAILVGFCVIVQNQMFQVPTEGAMAVEDLLYQMFPLTGMWPKVNSSMGAGWRNARHRVSGLGRLQMVEQDGEATRDSGTTGLTHNLTAGIVNGVLIFATFALTLPAIAMPTRGWLKLSGYFIVLNAVFSIILGLYLWIITLRTKETFSPVWNAQTATVQSLMQTTVRLASKLLCDLFPFM